VVVKQSGLKSDYPSLSSAEIENEWSYISVNLDAFVACARETLL